jgi:uncharacterized integral membrane protein
MEVSVTGSGAALAVAIAVSILLALFAVRKKDQLPFTYQRFYRELPSSSGSP